MKNILTDKQFSKWNKYQKKKHAELKPSSNNNSQMKSGGNGKGSGQGKGRNS